MAIQVSGTFGSRQEEAQRLGRILRPKKGENRAHFYTIITSNTVEEKFAHNRQLFLTEQGYIYEILNEEISTTFYKQPQDSIIRVICATFNFGYRKEGLVYHLSKR